MSNYIGVRCPVCNKKFGAADDIVVCPVCGAPHHRDCYTQSNQCAFVADHLRGKEWSAPPENGAGPDAGNPESKSCTRCGASNSKESIFCQICGNPLALPPPAQPSSQGQQWFFPGFQVQMDAISMAYGGLDEGEEIDGESVKDLARYVGSSVAYYLPKFKTMSETGRSIMPNFAAFFFNFLFYFYRKMYLIGGLLLALAIISRIPNFLYAWEVLPQYMHEMGMGPAVQINQAAADHFLSLSNLTSSINFFIGLIVSMCANRFYYSKTIATVNNLRTDVAKDKTREEYDAMLAQAGGCNKGIVLAVAATILAALLISSLVMVYLLVSTNY